MHGIHNGKTKIYAPNDFVFTSFVLFLSYLSEKLMSENALRDQSKSLHQQLISCFRKTYSFSSLTASSCHLRRRLVNFYGTLDINEISKKRILLRKHINISFPSTSMVKKVLGFLKYLKIRPPREKSSYALESLKKFIGNFCE